MKEKTVTTKQRKDKKYLYLFISCKPGPLLEIPRLNVLVVDATFHEVRSLVPNFSYLERLIFPTAITWINSPPLNSLRYFLKGIL